jgi:hypothetical protein
MLLRRLAENLKEQNWTAISIEFVLLVLGVFFGIQAQQWQSGIEGRKSEPTHYRLPTRSQSCAGVRVALSKLKSVTA